MSSCVVLFGNFKEDCIGYFAVNLGIHNPFYAELMGIILAIKNVRTRNRNHLWIETDSLTATLAFKNPSIAPWSLYKIWCNYLKVYAFSNFPCP